jgi:dTDP-4-dehydrorhamnose reductase
MVSETNHRILVLGASGQIGRELLRAFDSAAKFKPVAATSTGILSSAYPHSLSVVKIDIGSPFEISKGIADVSPAIIINAAAYTNVEKAEDEPEACNLLNHSALTEIGRTASNQSIPVIHFSTDYVYSGNGNLPQSENARLEPLSIYAKSKLQGENALAAANPKHLIFRTSWIYNATSNNFPRTILRHALTKEELRVVNDQIGSPTSARSVAEATLTAIEAMLQPGFNAWGTYNLACRGYCSWFDFAEFIVKTAKAQGYKLAVNRILPVPTSEYPTKAKRPHNSRLDVSKFESQFRHQMPGWQEEFLAIAPEMFESLALPR